MSSILPPFINPNPAPNQAVLPPMPQSTPAFLPPGQKVYPNLGDLIPTANIQYQRQPVAPVAGITSSEIPMIREAIAHNETRGQKEPYSYSRSSGSKVQGKALGRYQVTEGELKTYANRFLGHPVTPQTFLAHPEIQDQYMENKIQYLADKKLPVEKVLVAHRGGFSNFDALDQKLAQYKGYVDEGLTKYNQLKNERPQ